MEKFDCSDLECATEFCEKFNFDLVFFSKWRKSMTVKLKNSRVAKHIEHGDVCAIDADGGSGRIYKINERKPIYNE